MNAPWFWPRATVLRIVDGDTIRVSLDRGFHDSSEMTLRLAGIDTDELRSADQAVRLHAMAAKIRVAQLLPIGSVVALETSKPAPADKYGRWLARVILPSGECINDMLVSEGLARPYGGGPRPVPNSFQPAE